MVCSWCSIHASCGYCGSIFTALPGLSSTDIYILVGTSVAFLLCVLLLVLFLVHRQHQRKHSRSQGQGGVTWEGCVECWGDGLPPNSHPDCPQSPSTAKARSRGPRKGEDPGENDPRTPHRGLCLQSTPPPPPPPPRTLLFFSSGSIRLLT